jgi:hypothetical protein
MFALKAKVCNAKRAVVEEEGEEEKNVNNKKKNNKNKVMLINNILIKLKIDENINQVIKKFKKQSNIYKQLTINLQTEVNNYSILKYLNFGQI